MDKGKSVAITGALGNLGWKLLNHLAARGASPRLVGLDARAPEPGQSEWLRRVAQTRPVELVRCDLTDGNDRRWRDVVEEVEAIVHFAARNPFPDATWPEVAASLDMTLHVATAAADSGRARRFVFASSNHVMGRYKDPPLAEEVGAGQLRTDLAPGVGTLWRAGRKETDSTAYAASKLAGERVCRALAARARGGTTFACVRIGWCQPGENRPETLSGAGVPTPDGAPATGGLDAEARERADRWFRQMWLSNRDFAQLFERAVEAEAAGWPGGCVVVNGVSENTGMKWSLEEARGWLGYAPEDDVYG